MWPVDTELYMKLPTLTIIGQLFALQEKTFNLFMKTSLFFYYIYFNFCLIVILMFQNVDMDIYTHTHLHKIFMISSPNVKTQQNKRHYFANKSLSSQSYGFSISHVWMWELYCKESWALKNWCFWTVVLEKTLESPLHSKAIQPVHPKGDQSWVFIGRTDAEAETPVLWPPHVKSWLIEKDWCWERLRAGGEGDVRGWDGWMASPTL